MSTVTELRALVRGRMGVSANDNGLTDTILLGFINSAARAVDAEADWPWNSGTESLATVVGTATLTPGATWIGTKSLLIPLDGEDLEHVSIQEVDESPSGSRGRPRAFAVWQDKIVLYPIPDAVYTLTHRFYKAASSTLVAGSDATDITEPFLEGIIEYTTYLALRQLRRLEEGREALNAYNLWIKRSRDNALRVRGPYKIRVRPGSAV